MHVASESNGKMAVLCLHKVRQHEYLEWQGRWKQILSGEAVRYVNFGLETCEPWTFY